MTELVYIAALLIILRTGATVQNSFGQWRRLGLCEPDRHPIFPFYRWSSGKKIHSRESPKKKKKKATHLVMYFYPSERSKYVQDFNSFASTGKNNSYQSLTRSYVPTKYSIWFFSHIIFNPYYLYREGILSPHFISEETNSEKLIYQGHLICIWECWDSNLGRWVPMHTPTHKSI